MLSLLLQQARTDVNQVTFHGTALHMAAVENDVKCVEVLFRSDADTETTDGEGRKPI
jgi:ankyrin repeat protein